MAQRVGFGIYFVFKQVQFVVQAINLYKKILNREDAIIKLLIDIRDNTKTYSGISSVTEEVDGDRREPYSQATSDGNKVSAYCSNCYKSVDVPKTTMVCPICGKSLKGDRITQEMEERRRASEEYKKTLSK